MPLANDKNCNHWTRLTILALSRERREIHLPPSHHRGAPFVGLQRPC
jgi:hypothetical protein